MTASQDTKKPAKPHPSYPLYAHPGGQWVKKVKGKAIYCGPWDDPDAALDYWLKVKDRAFAGLELVDNSVLRLKALCEHFLDSKDAKVQLGKMTKRSFNDYKSACKMLVDFLGESVPAASLKPSDFTRFRLSFPATWSLRTHRNTINSVKTVFNWGYKEDFLDRPTKFGENFVVSKDEETRESADKPAKMFERGELHQLVAAASVPLKAMILLGINAGYGNIDCSRLRLGDVGGEWLSVARGKTTEPRKAWLWPETRKAIETALTIRPTPRAEFSDLVFITDAGVPYVDRDTKRDNLQKHFRAAKKSVGISRANSGFYGIRHSFQTQSEECSKDFPAIKFIMGHRDSTMSGNYREAISDERVKAVCVAMRSWWIAEKMKGGTK